MIDNAGCLEDLRIPPSNHLELLQGNRVGQYSIRINDQYRICLHVEGNNFFHVEILQEEFLEPVNLSTYKLAQEINLHLDFFQS